MLASSSSMTDSAADEITDPRPPVSRQAGAMMTMPPLIVAAPRLPAVRPLSARGAPFLLGKATGVALPAALARRRTGEESVLLALAGENSGTGGVEAAYQNLRPGAGPSPSTSRAPTRPTSAAKLMAVNGASRRGTLQGAINGIESAPVAALSLSLLPPQPMNGAEHVTLEQPAESPVDGLAVPEARLELAAVSSDSDSDEDDALVPRQPIDGRKLVRSRSSVIPASLLPPLVDANRPRRFSERAATSALQQQRDTQLDLLHDSNTDATAAVESAAITGLGQVNTSRVNSVNGHQPQRADADEHSHLSSSHAGDSQEGSQLQGELDGEIDGMDEFARAAIEDDAVKPEEVEERTISAFGQRTMAFIDSGWGVTLFTLATCYCLFGSPISVSSCAPSSDIVFVWLSSICIVLFALELLANCLWQESYIGSFFFWLDALAVVSLLPELPFVWVPLMAAVGGPSDADGATSSSSGSSSASSLAVVRAGRAGRAGTRAGRLVRMTRLVRFLRLVKIYKYFGGETAEDKEKRQRAEKKLQALKASGASTPAAVTSAVAGSSQEEVSTSVVPSVMKTGAVSDQAAIHKEAEADAAAAAEAEEDELAADADSRIGTSTSDFITRAVIVIVLCLLFALSLLRVDADDTSPLQFVQEVDQLVAQAAAANSDSSAVMTADSDQSSLMLMIDYVSENWRSKTSGLLLLQVVHPDSVVEAETYALWNDLDWNSVDPSLSLGVSSSKLLYNVVDQAALDGLRSNEIRRFLGTRVSVWVSAKPDAVVTALFNIGTTLVVTFLIAVASAAFSNDTQQLVLKPIQSMFAFVTTLARNPLAKITLPDSQGGAGGKTAPGEKRVGQLRQPLETQLLEQTFCKLAGLLQISFGSAGAEIISHNMHRDYLNPLVAGRKCFAIFGFCELRRFPAITEALSEQVLAFTNLVADSVHECVVSSGGGSNKNLGNAFLMVWKPDTQAIRRASQVAALEEEGKKKLRITTDEHTEQQEGEGDKKAALASPLSDPNHASPTSPAGVAPAKGVAVPSPKQAGSPGPVGRKLSTTSGMSQVSDGVGASSTVPTGVERRTRTTLQSGQTSQLTGQEDFLSKRVGSLAHSADGTGSIVGEGGRGSLVGEPRAADRDPGSSGAAGSSAQPNGAAAGALGVSEALSSGSPTIPRRRPSNLRTTKRPSASVQFASDAMLEPPSPANEPTTEGLPLSPLSRPVIPASFAFGSPGVPMRRLSAPNPSLPAPIDELSIGPAALHAHDTAIVALDPTHAARSPPARDVRQGSSSSMARSLQRLNLEDEADSHAAMGLTTVSGNNALAAEPYSRSAAPPNRVSTNQPSSHSRSSVSSSDATGTSLVHSSAASAATGVGLTSPTSQSQSSALGGMVGPVYDAMRSLADRAMVSFLQVLLRVAHAREFAPWRSHPQLISNAAVTGRPVPADPALRSFEIDMGFGLHVGWAIEGAIGSIYKVDASYLSPNVNISSRLMAASKQYGVSLLMSGSFVSLLMPEIRALCRMVDRVTVKGSKQPIDIWTFDVSMKGKKSKAAKAQIRFEMEMKRIQQQNGSATGAEADLLSPEAAAAGAAAASQGGVREGDVDRSSSGASSKLESGASATSSEDSALIDILQPHQRGFNLMTIALATPTSAQNGATAAATNEAATAARNQAGPGARRGSVVTAAVDRFRSLKRQVADGLTQITHASNKVAPNDAETAAGVELAPLSTIVTSPSLPEATATSAPAASSASVTIHVASQASHADSSAATDGTAAAASTPHSASAATDGKAAAARVAGAAGSASSVPAAAAVSSSSSSSASDSSSPPSPLLAFCRRLQTGLPSPTWVSDFNTAVQRYYLPGRWSRARQLLESRVLSVSPEDKPTLRLINFMREHNFKAPKSWHGFRKLTEK